MTPAYKGTSQPVAQSGWLAGISSWFGGGTQPTYASKPVTPPPVAAPSSAQVTSDDQDACPIEPERITVLIPPELIGPQQ